MEAGDKCTGGGIAVFGKREGEIPNPLLPFWLSGWLNVPALRENVDIKYKHGYLESGKGFLCNSVLSSIFV